MSRQHWPAKAIASGLIALLTVFWGNPCPAQQLPPADSSSSAQSYPNAPDPSQPQTAQPESSSNQQSGDTRPLGTAAAIDMKPTGVTGSMLSGAAIAPAKQHRVRIILISLGVVAATAIAVGTVAGLSHGSPSQPH